MTVEAYLEELRAALPSTRRKRFLAEAEAHLRDAVAARIASGADPLTAVAGAVEEFGPPAVVAARMRAATAPIEIRRAGVVALVALGSLVAPLYVVPENLLPPAPWQERPAYLSVLLVAALGSWLLALLLVAVALVTRPLIASAALVGAVTVAALCGLCALAAAVTWHVEAPETPWSIVAIAVPLTAAVIGGAAVAAAWARDRAKALAG